LDHWFDDVTREVFTWVGICNMFPKMGKPDGAGGSGGWFGREPFENDLMSENATIDPRIRTMTVVVEGSISGVKVRMRKKIYIH
jgi:hypothetical protein